MRKILILTSVLAPLGAGNALAFDASDGFGTSSQSNLPAPRFQLAEPNSSIGGPLLDRRVVTGSVQDSSGTQGSHGTVGNRAGWSAADGFGPSSDNLVKPRFQVVR